MLTGDLLSLLIKFIKCILICIDSQPGKVEKKYIYTLQINKFHGKQKNVLQICPGPNS